MKPPLPGYLYYPVLIICTPLAIASGANFVLNPIFDWTHLAGLLGIASIAVLWGFPLSARTREYTGVMRAAWGLLAFFLLVWLAWFALFFLSGRVN